jgi:flagellar protein FlbD
LLFQQGTDLSSTCNANQGKEGPGLGFKERAVRDRGFIMIYVTRLNGERIMLNSDLIEYMEETPDTVITLTTGKKIVVLESAVRIREEIIRFRKRINMALKI